MRNRDVPAAGRPPAAPVHPDRHAAELVQLRAEIETVKTGLILRLVVGSLAIVIGLIVLVAR